jgi:hypothetical protein
MKSRTNQNDLKLINIYKEFSDKIGIKPPPDKHIEKLKKSSSEFIGLIGKNIPTDQMRLVTKKLIQLLRDYESFRNYNNNQVKKHLGKGFGKISGEKIQNDGS